MQNGMQTQNTTHEARYQIQIVEGEWSSTGPHYYRAVLVDTQQVLSPVHPSSVLGQSPVVYTYVEAYREAEMLLERIRFYGDFCELDAGVRDAVIVERPPTEAEENAAFAEWSGDNA